MAFIVEQEIKGNIYLYLVESQWDKEKKKTFQKRKYLGAKYPKKGKKTSTKGSNLLNKSYGNVLLLQYLAKQTGIDVILKSYFPDCFEQILAFTYYQICMNSSFYLFPYWLEEHHLPNVKKLDSSAISTLLTQIGQNEKGRLAVLEQWITHLSPLKTLYYDISSISSYSSNLSFIEWGYNRDKDQLAQLNIGLVCCQQTGLPIYYRLHQGSIVDVTTLNNCRKYLAAFGLNNFLFILDKGFFSLSNIGLMNQPKKVEDKIEFIIGLPFKLKKAKQLLRKYKRPLSNLKTSFSYKGQIINHIRTEVEFEKQTFDAHIFYNEQIALQTRHRLLNALLELETKKLAQLSFASLKEWKAYRNKHLPTAYNTFFSYNTKTKKAQKNIRKINAHLNTAAYFILLTNRKGLTAHSIMEQYFTKDMVEKMFDILKNELDAKRVRMNKDDTATAKLFILFIALIIHAQMTRIMKEHDLFKQYTIKELLLELKKIKINYLSKDQIPIISEVSKKQKKILKVFDLNLIPGY